MSEREVLQPGTRHPITIEPTGTRVTVELGGRVVVDTERALTLREASYPPVQYVPLEDVDPELLRSSTHTTYCPYKGEASYYDLLAAPGGDDVATAAVWTYAAPHDAVSPIRGHVAFDTDKVGAVAVHGAV